MLIDQGLPVIEIMDPAKEEKHTNNMTNSKISRKPSFFKENFSVI